MKLSRSGGRVTALLPEEQGQGDNECYHIPITLQGIRKCSINRGHKLKEGGEPCALKRCKHGSEGGQGFLRVRLPYPTTIVPNVHAVMAWAARQTLAVNER